MHLRCWPFRQLWRCDFAIQTASPNAACPVLYRKPLYAAIGDYPLRTAPAAARATANKTTIQNVSTLLTISMAMLVRRYYTARIPQWRRSRAFIKTTKGRRRASTHSDTINRTHLPLILGVYLIVKTLKKGLSCPYNNRGMTHQSDEKHLHNMKKIFVVVVKLALYW